MRRIIITICLIITACSAQPDIEVPEEIAALENLTVYGLNPSSSANIVLEPVAAFGDTDEFFINRLGQFTVDETDRVYLADFGENIIHVYNGDGSYLGKLGGRGEGPGEFTNMGQLQIAGEYLFAQDFMQHRINVFSLEKREFSRVVQLSRIDEEGAMSFPGDFFPISEQQMLIGFSEVFRFGGANDGERFTIYYLSGLDGKIEPDPVFKLRLPDFLMDETDGGFRVMNDPFSSRSLIAVRSGSHVFTAWTKDFLVKEYDISGNYKGAFYYPYPAASLNRDEAIRGYEDDWQRRMVRGAEAPENWPALRHMIVDDENRFWISTITEDQDVYDWWVLRENGERLASVTLPRTQVVQHVKNGYLYARVTDDDSGLVEVVKYKIEFEE